jgi:hypothetical protein
LKSSKSTSNLSPPRGGNSGSPPSELSLEAKQLLDSEFALARPHRGSSGSGGSGGGPAEINNMAAHRALYGARAGSDFEMGGVVTACNSVLLSKKGCALSRWMIGGARVHQPISCR